MVSALRKEKAKSKLCLEVSDFATFSTLKKQAIPLFVLWTCVLKLEMMMMVYCIVETNMNAIVCVCRQHLNCFSSSRGCNKHKRGY